MTAKGVWTILTGRLEVLGPTPPEVRAVRDFFDRYGWPDPLTEDDVKRAMEVVM